MAKFRTLVKDLVVQENWEIVNSPVFSPDYTAEIYCYIIQQFIIILHKDELHAVFQQDNV